MKKKQIIKNITISIIIGIILGSITEIALILNISWFLCFGELLYVYVLLYQRIIYYHLQIRV